MPIIVGLWFRGVRPFCAIHVVTLSYLCLTKSTFIRIPKRLTVGTRIQRSTMLNEMMKKCTPCRPLEPFIDLFVCLIARCNLKTLNFSQLVQDFTRL